MTAREKRPRRPTGTDSYEALYRQQIRQGAFLGLSPSAVERLAPADMAELLAGDRLRHNRAVRLACWFLCHLPLAVAAGIALAGWGSEESVKAFRALSMDKLLKVAPNYDRKLAREGRRRARRRR